MLLTVGLREPVAQGVRLGLMLGLPLAVRCGVALALVERVALGQRETLAEGVPEEKREPLGDWEGEGESVVEWQPVADREGLAELDSEVV